jgi:hypothetical protein
MKEEDSNKLPAILISLRLVLIGHLLEPKTNYFVYVWRRLLLYVYEVIESIISHWCSTIIDSLLVVLYCHPTMETNPYNI